MYYPATIREMVTSKDRKGLVPLPECHAGLDYVPRIFATPKTFAERVGFVIVQMTLPI